MNAPLLSGMFGAWAAVQFALGGFFLLAYAARRQDFEYLLFGLLCFALAVIDVGMTLAYRATTIAEWPLSAIVASAGAVMAAALNSHFALTYANRRPSRGLIVAIYSTALVFLAADVLGYWYQFDTMRIEPMNHLGLRIDQVVATPTYIGAAFYGLLIATQFALVVIVFRAHRSGQYGARLLLVGFSVAVLVGVNDALVTSGLIETMYMSPYGFLIYGFSVASTLLGRYQRAAEDLEATAGELRQATDELTSSYLELSDVQEELFRRKQLASVGELAAAIAHEVRNPLAVIRNAAANLRRPQLEADNRNTLFEIIEEEIKHLNGLVTELVRFARPVKIERSDVALSDALAASAATIGAAYEVELAVSTDPRVQSVWADPALLRLALENILANACQAAPKGSRVEVHGSLETIEDAPRVRIDVRDQGSGMDPETLSRALDPFFTTRPKGTGLGLPIAHRIVDAHDGELTLESSPSEGTTVIIRLPAGRRETANSSEARPNTVDGRDAEEAPASGPRQRTTA